MSELNNQLQQALVDALEELFNAEDEAHATNLITVISEIRDDLNLIMMTSEYVEKHVWSKLRNVTSNIQTLMSTATTFLQGIDDVEGAIRTSVAKFVPFTNKTLIVDEETITKAAEHKELEDILLANYWLFFLMYAATNKRVINAYLLTRVPAGKGKANGS